MAGNHLAATEPRLEELRQTWAAPLPGIALAVLDQEHRTVTQVLLAEDGPAPERSVLEQVYPVVQPRDRWVAERNFCTAAFLPALRRRAGFFAVRQHGNVPVEALGKRQPSGRCATGRLDEQPVRLRDEDGQPVLRRRVTVMLDKPSRAGDTEIHIRTHLPARVPTKKVAEVYRQRGTIAGRCFEVSQTLSCAIDTLGYPKAALCALCGGLLASKAVAVLKAALRAEPGEAVVSPEVSGYYLALEIRQTSVGMMVAMPARPWQVFRELSATDRARGLRPRARHVWLPR